MKINFTVTQNFKSSSTISLHIFFLHYVNDILMSFHCLCVFHIVELNFYAQFQRIKLKIQYFSQSCFMYLILLHCTFLTFFVTSDQLFCHCLFHYTMLVCSSVVFHSKLCFSPYASIKNWWFFYFTSLSYRLICFTHFYCYDDQLFIICSY